MICITLEFKEWVGHNYIYIYVCMYVSGYENADTYFVDYFVP